MGNECDVDVMGLRFLCDAFMDPMLGTGAHTGWIMNSSVRQARSWRCTTCRIRCVLICFGTAFPISPSSPSSSRGIAGLMIARIRPPLAWDNQWKGGQSGVIDTALMYSSQCVNGLLACVMLSVGNRPWCPLMDYTRGYTT